jgi:hypothetical protein
MASGRRRTATLRLNSARHLLAGSPAGRRRGELSCYGQAVPNFDQIDAGPDNPIPRAELQAPSGRDQRGSQTWVHPLEPWQSAFVQLSHHSTSLQVRERLVVSSDEAPTAIPAVLLSTCNRVEAYAWANGGVKYMETSESRYADPAHPSDS